MRFYKYIVLTTAILYCSASVAFCQPAAAEIQSFLRSNIIVYYLANPNTSTPDFREITAGTVDGATNNIIFGKSSNNRMDVSAQLVSALLSSKNGDPDFQRTIYDHLQKLKKPLTLTLVNDVAADLDKQYLPRYGFYVFEWNGRTNIWPASYPGSTPSVILGEYFNRNPAQIKQVFADLLASLSTGVYGAAAARKPGERVSNTVRYDLAKLTSAEMDLWNRAQSQQLGVIGNDYDGRDEIGTAPVERKMNLGITDAQFLDFWFPNTRPQDNKRAFKQTMIGHVKGSEHYENSIVFPDYDIDFYVEPDAAHKYLITESPKPNVNYKSAFGNLVHLDWPSCPDVFDEVEAEIDIKDINEKQFTAFFNDEMKRTGSAGFYGAWIYDRGHCDHPEIHPAEQIWWSYKTENVYTYRCNLICDYSGRYNKTSQYDGHGGDYSVMRPWAEGPVKGVFAIPFAVKPGSEKVIFRIIAHDTYNLNANNSVGFNKARIDHFMLGGKRLVSVVEPENKSMNVTFENVGYNASGDVLGFIVITTAVGKDNADHSQEPGHIFFEVKKETVNTTRPTDPPGKIKVTLESIECTAVDDDGDEEEIYGTVTCKAFAVKDTVEFKPERLPFTSNLSMSACSAGQESLFCLACPKWLRFKKGTVSTFGGALTYNFPAEGYLEISGDLDESDSENCKDFDYLGVPQKKILLTSEIGSQPLKFSQYFASGKTMMKINYNVQCVP
jgi:hypothetical protein